MISNLIMTLLFGGGMIAGGVWFLKAAADRRSSRSIRCLFLITGGLAVALGAVMILSIGQGLMLPADARAVLE